MTAQPAPAVTLIANPYMEATHYGIGVACLGVDGDVIALGHHDDEKALAAFRAHLDLSLGHGERVSRGWALFRKPQPGTAEEECWWITEEVTAGTPGALPVTYLEL